MIPYRIFFSHGGDDTYVVEQFLKPKVEESGATVFLDAGEIAYGGDFRQLILSELANCDELLVLFTKSSLRRPWVLAELGATLIRDKRIVAIRNLPIASAKRNSLPASPASLVRFERVKSRISSMSALSSSDLE